MGELPVYRYGRGEGLASIENATKQMKQINNTCYLLSQSVVYVLVPPALLPHLRF